MLMIFKSPASGDVIMFEENGKALLNVLGKDPGNIHGVLTTEQLPGAMAALRSAIEDDKAEYAGTTPETEAGDKNGGGVRLFQRALPLLEMLERSLKEKEPVTWGV